MHIGNCKLQIGGRVALAVMMLSCASVFSALAADKGEPSEATERETVTEQGQVVWLAERLDRRYDVSSVPEAKERILALETEDGRLLPLLENVRGRAFRRDERLRKMKVELQARRLEHAPFLQIIRVVELKDGKRYEIDYWCEICAIAMYELKPCDCCQGPIELRRREAN